MLLLQLDESSNRPRYKQIIDRIVEAIETRTLLPGERLPSTRELAASLEMHRSTVATAYQELWSLGYVDLTPGSYPKVRDRIQKKSAHNRIERSTVDWANTASQQTNAILGAFRQMHPENAARPHPGVIDFSGLDMDLRLVPLESFRMCLNRAVENQGSDLLGYGDCAGYYPLREYVARRLHTHGISADIGEVIITNGSQHGLDLVLRMIAAPNRCVAVESPTYDFVLPLLRFCGLRPVEIPVRHDGMDLEVLSRVINNDRPALVYTMPTFQNPTGVTTSQAHRERLLSLCEAHQLPILEDGFDEEMKYQGKIVLPIKSMDRANTVIYCGTFSKVLFPGIRIGWIVADRQCIERLAAIRRFSELSSNLVLQAAVHEFCAGGYYDRHISKMHRVFRKRMTCALESLEKEISPRWADWVEPHGGYLIWLNLKSTPNKTNWKQMLASHGVKVATGHQFFPSDIENQHLRLSISRVNEGEIAEGIRRLGAALRTVYEG